MISVGNLELPPDRIVKKDDCKPIAKSTTKSLTENNLNILK